MDRSRLYRYLNELEKSRIIKRVNDKVELAHDSLALKIAEKRSEEENNIIKARNWVIDGYRDFRETGSYLNQNKLNFIYDYETYLTDLSPQELDYLKKSKIKDSQSRRIQFLTAIIILIMTCSAILASYAYVLVKNQKATLEKQTYILESQKYTLERQKVTLQIQKDSLETQKNVLENQKDTLQAQKNLLVFQKNILTKQKDTLEIQKDSLVFQKNILTSQKDTLQIQKDSLVVAQSEIKSFSDLKTKRIRIRSLSTRAPLIQDTLQVNILALEAFIAAAKIGEADYDPYLYESLNYARKLDDIPLPSMNFFDSLAITRYDSLKTVRLQQLKEKNSQLSKDNSIKKESYGRTGILRLFFDDHVEILTNSGPVLVPAGEGTCTSVAFRPAPEYQYAEQFAMGFRDGHIEIWQISGNSVKTLYKLPQHQISQEINEIIFTNAGNLMAATDQENLQFWNLDYPDMSPVVLRRNGEGYRIESITFNETEDYLISSEYGGSLKKYPVRLQDLAFRVQYGFCHHAGGIKDIEWEYISDTVINPSQTCENIRALFKNYQAAGGSVDLKGLKLLEMVKTK